MPAHTVTASDLMTGQPITLSSGDSVARVLALMQRSAVHELPVLSDGRFVGLVTLENIAERTNLALSTKVENLLVLPPRFTPSTNWEEVARGLLASGLRAAPIVDRADHLLGIVSRSDVVRILPAVSRLADATVDDVASPIGLTVRDREGIGRIVNLVREEPPAAVIDRGGRLVGSVGIADLARAFWHPKTAGKGDLPSERAGHGSVLEVETRTIMRSPAVAVPCGSPILAAVELMVRNSISSVFVVRRALPVGAVTQTDLLELAVGGHPSAHPSEAAFFRLHGFSIREAPGLVADIDHAVGQGLARIGRRVSPLLLDLHVNPEGFHRTGHATVTARLHTSWGILRARRSAWDVRVGVGQVLRQIERQAGALANRRRRPSRERSALRRLRQHGTLS